MLNGVEYPAGNVRKTSVLSCRRGNKVSAIAGRRERGQVYVLEVGGR